MSLRVYCARRGPLLVPVTEEAEENVRTLPSGHVLRADVFRPRSAKQLALYYGLCKKIAEHLQEMGDEHATKDLIDTRYRVRLGLYDLVPLPAIVARETGQRYAIAKRSIAFDKMDQAEFNVVMDRLTAFTLTELLPHFPLRQMRREIEDILKVPHAED